MKLCKSGSKSGHSPWSRRCSDTNARKVCISSFPRRSTPPLLRGEYGIVKWCVTRNPLATSRTVSFWNVFFRHTWDGTARKKLLTVDNGRGGVLRRCLRTGKEPAIFLMVVPEHEKILMARYCCTGFGVLELQKIFLCSALNSGTFPLWLSIDFECRIGRRCRCHLKAFSTYNFFGEHRQLFLQHYFHSLRYLQWCRGANARWYHRLRSRQRRNSSSKYHHHFVEDLWYVRCFEYFETLLDDSFYTIRSQALRNMYALEHILREETHEEQYIDSEDLPIHFHLPGHVYRCWYMHWAVHTSSMTSV